MLLRRLAVGIVLAAALTGLAMAQSEDQRHYTINAGAGLTTIVGYDSGRLDHGGNFQVGGGYFFNRYLGITGNFMYNQLGITGQELRLLNEPDGNARVYSLTADPTVRFPLRRGWSAYVLAGGGYVRRTVQFTQPTVAQTTVFDPWWGYFGPAFVPVNQILGSVTSNSGAFDVGGGVNIPLPNTSVHLYVESRYVKGFTSNSHTTVVPIVFGVRF